MVALEEEQNFLADPEEIKEAREEGITILPARGPREIVVENGRLEGLKTLRVLSIFDEQGRFSPVYDENDECLHPADMIVEAIGQAPDASILSEELVEQLEWERGRVKLDENGHTSLSWLWGAGDLVQGPDVVSAVASGHRAAESIHRHLMEES